MMTDPLTLTAIVIIAAVIFDFVNGFHDAANSIATIVATRVLTPRQAVLWAAFFNFTALFFFNTGVAKTVGKGMIALNSVTIFVILAGLIGAIAWGLLSWWWRMPTSSSHALLGGYAGAAVCHSGLHGGWDAAFDPILADGWLWTLLFIVIAPVTALLIGHILMWLTGAFEHLIPEERRDTFYASMQLASSACLSLMHGANDAQKTAGIMAGALVAAGYSKDFNIPYWVLSLSYLTMALGTLTGGWRIVRTLGSRITRLHVDGGFCAETGAALAIFVATMLKLPVSTTQVTTGSILGVGAAQDMEGVNWNVAVTILWAWLLTIPAAALFGATMLYAIEHFKN